MKILDILSKINTAVLVLAALFTATNSIMGNILFIYTSTIGMICGIRDKNFNGIVVNATFLALNIYFLIKRFF